MVRHEELITLEEMKRAGGRLEAKTAPGINGVPNEILKEVIVVYPEILLEAFNSCLREGKFFDKWKRQRLVLLRKGEKPLEDFSSYRPICLLDTMGKLLEEMILQRLQGHMVGKNGLSQNQFGFRKGRSTVDAIQALADIATKSRRGTGKRKGFCALISIDIRNAFNTARWNICIEAMVRKKVPDYLLQMIDDYLSDRWVIYEGDEWSLKDEVGGKKSIKYLRVQLDRRLSFGVHPQNATAKAIQCGAALTPLMPNIGGRREAKRRLVASVVNSKLFYAAPV